MVSSVQRAPATKGSDERFELLDELVRYDFPPQTPTVGSDAEVWRATDLLTGDTVAIKIMPIDRVGDGDLRDRLRNEALVGARLSILHSNILPVRDLGMLGRRLFIVTDWIEDSSLQRRCGRLSLQECVTIVTQCGNALRTVHAEGVLHTDICPHNILYVKKERRALIADFGLATAVDGHAEWLGRDVAVHRRPAYLPPPGHPAHPPPINTALDTYALAMTFRALLTGKEEPIKEDEELVVTYTGHPVPTRLVDLVHRYTITGKSDDTAERFTRDLWRAIG